MADRKANLLALRARRQTALARPELRGLSRSRFVAPAGVTSAPVKAADPALAEAIARFLARPAVDPREGGDG